MNVQGQSTVNNGRYGATVRDVIVAKAIQNGYNPFCRSTDAAARQVTEEMRAKVQNVFVPAVSATPKNVKKEAVREVKNLPSENVSRPRREVIQLENFELVKKRGTSLSLSMFVSVMITAIVLSMVVFSGSLINEEARRNAELNSTLATLKEEDKNLTLALEEKNDLDVIEDVAKNDLGMVKVSAADQRYISLSDGNTVAVYEQEGDDTPVSMRLLNTFGEKISGALEYLD